MDKPDGAWRFSDEERAEMVRLYVVEKLSLRAVAAKYGCSWSTVRNYVKRAGFELRDPVVAGKNYGERRKRSLREAVARVMRRA